MPTKKIVSALGAFSLLATLVVGASAPAEAATKHYTFTAYSNSGRADVSYYGDGSSASLKNRRTPWTKKVGASGYIYTLSVSNLTSETTTVKCVIRNPAGKVVKKRTATGAYASASCTYVKKF